MVITSPTHLGQARMNRIRWCLPYLLEKVFLFAMVVAKEGDGVCHHPDVASATVIIRFVPLTILLTDGDD